MRHPAMAGFVIALTLVATSATAGVITGTLLLGARPPRTKPAAAALQRQPGVTDAVIFVEQVSEQTERDLSRPRRFLFFHASPRPRVLTVVQRTQFNPRVAMVPIGTQVVFLNLDRVYHNIFSVSPARRFDLGKHAPGSRDTVRFDRAGVVNLHCDIHPDELGYVVVTPNHAYARPDSVGHYRLPKLPPGTYTVHVFHPRSGEFTCAAEVPRRGDLVLDLVK